MTERGILKLNRIGDIIHVGTEKSIYNFYHIEAEDNGTFTIGFKRGSSWMSMPCDSWQEVKIFIEWHYFNEDKMNRKFLYKFYE